MLPDWDERELLDEVLVVPGRAYLPLPDLRVIERPGWLQIITPSFKQGGMNQIWSSRLDPSEADDVIDATVAQYRRLGIRFRWKVLPTSTPADLGERLARRGLTPYSVVAMARSTDPPPDAAHPSIRVVQVEAEQVEAFNDLVALGWECEREPFSALHRLAVAQPEHGMRLFMAFHAEVPAAVAVSMSFARSEYLMGGVVLPAFRGRGLYRALVAARVRDAASRGRSLASCHALEETSAPVLLRMGFVGLCRYQVYQG